MSTVPLPVIPRHPETSFHWIMLGLSTAVLALAWLLGVHEGSRVIVPGLGFTLPDLCTSRRVFGIDCPGCGMTRCFISLAHADIASAWRYNPAGVWLFAILAFQIPYRVVQLWRIRRRLPELSLHGVATWAFIILGAALVIQWIVRFLPL